MLRACAIFFEKWDECLNLAEFSYNNSYQESIRTAPIEALYGKKCRTPFNWVEVGDRGYFGPDFIKEAREQVSIIQSHLKAAQSRQKTYADKRRRPLQFEVGDHVYLKVSPIIGVHRFGVCGKLAPRYVGPSLVRISFLLALSYLQMTLNNTDLLSSFFDEIRPKISMISCFNLVKWCPTFLLI